jgi:hypothetical protein
MNHALRCRHCRALFVPNPRVQAPHCCSQQSCQRARKPQWQRDKRARAPDSRATQRDCPRHWQRRPPYSWRPYRPKRAASCHRHRLRQRHRDRKRRLGLLAQLDALSPNYPLLPVTETILPKRTRSTCLGLGRSIAGKAVTP